MEGGDRDRQADGQMDGQRAQLVINVSKDELK
jgi:hypothetical protein